jgi:hypothetical protein
LGIERDAGSIVLIPLLPCVPFMPWLCQPNVSELPTLPMPPEALVGGVGKV